MGSDKEVRPVVDDPVGEIHLPGFGRIVSLDSPVAHEDNEVRPLAPEGIHALFHGCLLVGAHIKAHCSHNAHLQAVFSREQGRLALIGIGNPGRVQGCPCVLSPLFSIVHDVIVSGSHQVYACGRENRRIFGRAFDIVLLLHLLVGCGKNPLQIGQGQIIGREILFHIFKEVVRPVLVIIGKEGTTVAVNLQLPQGTVANRGDRDGLCLRDRLLGNFFHCRAGNRSCLPGNHSRCDHPVPAAGRNPCSCLILCYGPVSCRI